MSSIINIGRGQRPEVSHTPVSLQYLEVTVEDHDAGSQPANAEQHPVEGDVYRVLAEIVDCGGDEISLVGVSVVANQRS